MRAQARDRFGYLMPGETAYVVLDEDGEPIETRSELHDPGQVLREPPVAVVAGRLVAPSSWPATRPSERGLAPASELDAPGE